MPSTQISSDGQLFVATISGAEISPTSPQGQALSFDLCDLFIDRVDGNIDFLQEGYGDSMSLGDIQFEATEDIAQYELQQFEPSDFVENKLSLSTVVTFVDSNFDPCLLDRNQDGVITAQDVQNLYDTYVNTTNPNYDIDNSGLVTENDRQLALQYVGTLCDTPIGDPPPVPQPVLNLDCLTYNQGDEQWLDLSGNDYHFAVTTSTNGNSLPPIKNEDGSITVGLGPFLPDDPGGARRSFLREGAITYPEGTSFTSENIAAGTADAAAAERDLYIPGVDQNFSFEFVYRFTPFLNHGQDIAGFGGPGGQSSGGQRAKIFGYPNYGQGGFNFGTGYVNTAYAFDSDSFVPYRGIQTDIYGGYGAGTQPGTWNGETGYPHPSEYPNQLPYSLLSNSPYHGRSTGDPSISLNLDTMFGIPTSLDKFYVTVVFNIQEGQAGPGQKGSKTYLNGHLIHEDLAIGIGIPNGTKNFVIGANMQGGWSWPDGVDVFSLKIYDVALTEQEVLTKYQENLNKYGV
tara:strand:+ start:688 stop:2232 length:1545 start_codon:yes stop_codon:yes gene_type:complete